MRLTKEIKEQIIELQKCYPSHRSALIPALHLAQSQNGYLPEEIQQQVADLFDITLNEVKAVVAFYDMFYEKPMGKHLIHVCKNLSCMLRGSDALLENLCKKLGVCEGGTTADGEITVIPSECLGACDRAPMMLVDHEVIGPVQDSQIDQILEETRSRRGHG
jgi:NADH-quinone oxidoreductase subunit E